MSWKGFTEEEDNTWEGLDNLTGAKALVAAFDKKASKQSPVKNSQKPKAKGGGGRSPAAAPNPPSSGGSGKRGRPSNKRKAEAAAAAAAASPAAKKKRGPGRPRKSPAPVEEDGSESDTYNLSQETDYGEASQRQAAADRGIDSRSSGRLKTLKHELSGAKSPSISHLHLT